MRATLLHNPTSGSAEDDRALVVAFGEIGWDVHRSFEKSDLDECFDDPGDAVIVAGGDGTVGKVAKRLAGTNVPIVIIPAGTANNVARSLGIGVDARAAVHGLADPRERTMDLGMATIGGIGGEQTPFLEAFGVGVFAYVVGERASKKDKKLRKGLTLLADTLDAYDPRAFEIEIDGKDLSGEYLMVEAMNVRSFGPALAFAPDALIDDGQLDLVLVRPESREPLITHLRRAVEEGDNTLPAFETHRGRHVRIRATGRWSHADSRARELEAEVRLDVMPGAVRLLVPAPAALHASER